MHGTRRAAAKRRRPDRDKFAARGSRRRGNLLRAGFDVSRRHANEHSEQPIERNTCADVAFKSPDRRTIHRPKRLADRTSPAPRSGLTGFGRQITHATVSTPPGYERPGAAGLLARRTSEGFTISADHMPAFASFARSSVPTYAPRFTPCCRGRYRNNVSAKPAATIAKPMSRPLSKHCATRRRY